MTGAVHTIVARRFNPAAAEIVERPFGATIGEIVAQEFPNATADQRARLVIVLVVDNREQDLTLELHALYRPPSGATVRFHMAIRKGGGLLRSLLMAVVIVFAGWAGPLLFGAGLLGTLGTGAITALGGMLVNALIPVEGPKPGERPDPRYMIGGARNEATPYGKIPENLGRIRIFPCHAAQPWTEGLGTDRYTRFLFVLGYSGPEYEDWKIGSTPLEEFKDYELQVYRVEPDEPWPVVGYPNPVFEDNFDIFLKQERGWEVRAAPKNCDLLSVEFSCKNGLYHSGKDGKTDPCTIIVAIEYAEVGTELWTPVKTLTIKDEVKNELRFGHQWLAPRVANWKIRTRRVNGKDKRDTDDVWWACARGVRPTRPIRYNKTIDVAYLRIRSSEQATGFLDKISCVANAVLPDWDEPTQTWITRRTRSVAAAMRRIAEGPANPVPTPIEEMDLDWHAELARYGTLKGLTFDISMDRKISVDEALRMAARAGRAFPTRPEGRRSGYIDRPNPVVYGVVSARNAVNFGGEPSYADEPDAIRVSFLDETDDWKQTERIVRRPGLEGAPKSFATMDLPGWTNPTKIWQEVIRRFAEAEKRFETLNCEQGLQALFAPPGARISAQFLTIDERQASGRVIDVAGDLVVIDEEVLIEAGQDYACEFRSREDQSVYTLGVEAAEGRRTMFRLTGEGPRPKVGDVALFGLAGHVSEDVVVKEIEPLGNDRARLTLVAHAPELEAIADQAAPDWYPVDIIPRPDITFEPAVPEIVSISSGGPVEDLNEDDGIPGTDPPLVVVCRAGPDGPTTALTDRIIITASQGGDDVEREVTTGYGRAEFYDFDEGDAVTITARAVSLYGIDGPATDPVPHTIQPTTDVAPTILSFEVVLEESGQIRCYWTTSDVEGSRARLRSGPAGSVFADMTSLHVGYATASPFVIPTDFEPGERRIGLVLEDEDTRLASAPAYDTVTVPELV